MISFCLKSLDKETIDKLENAVDKINFKDIFYSQKKFSKFYNLIVHYVGPHKNDFYDIISETIANFIIENYEDKIVLNQIHLEFFYFSKNEQFDLFNNAKKMLNMEDLNLYKKKILQDYIRKYTLDNHKFNVNGFINFRISDYKNYIYSVLEEVIHNYIIEKEYIEYVNLLKDYVSVKQSQSEKIHLIYSNNESTLIDADGNIITTTNEKKYLSDISFSKNDFILNSILSILPEKLIIHTCKSDNFIQFLQSVFENRYELCFGCKLCMTNTKTRKKCLN